MQAAMRVDERTCFVRCSARSQCDLVGVAVEGLEHPVVQARVHGVEVPACAADLGPYQRVRADQLGGHAAAKHMNSARAVGSSRSTPQSADVVVREPMAPTRSEEHKSE